MKIIKHLIAITLSLLFLLGVAMTLMALEDANFSEEENQKQVATLPTVSVINTSRITHHVTLTLHGEVEPLWRTAIKAKKTAEVRTISNRLAVGKRVKKGSTLITFDNANYKTKIAEIKHQIAQAELLIIEEKQKAKLAKTDWRLAGRRGSPSVFALRQPQLKAAYAQLSLAKVLLDETQKTGSYATLTSPYNGIVVSRSVNLGDLVNEGQALAELITADDLNISLKLDEQQWGMLGSTWKNQTVAVYPSTTPGKTATNWTAKIDRAGGVIDSKTRTRSLYLSVNSREKPLPGSLVRVDIKGKKLTGLLKIPQSALTANGYIWFVDGHRLDRISTSAIFSEGEYIYVKVPEGSNKTQFSIVKTPLASFHVGIKVAVKQKDAVKQKVVAKQDGK